MPQRSHTVDEIGKSQKYIVRRESKFVVFLSPLEIIYGPWSVAWMIYPLIVEMKHACSFYHIRIFNVAFS